MARLNVDGERNPSEPTTQGSSSVLEECRSKVEINHLNSAQTTWAGRKVRIAKMSPKNQAVSLNEGTGDRSIAFRLPKYLDHKQVPFIK